MEAKLNHACEEKRPWLPRCTIRCPWLPGCTMRCLLVHRSHDCHAPVTSIFRPRTPPSAIRAMLPIQNKSGWDIAPTFSCELSMDGWWYQTCRMKPKSIFFCPRMQRHVPHIAGPPRPAQARHWVPSWPSCPRLPPATTKSCHVFNNKTRVDVLCFRPAAKIDSLWRIFNISRSAQSSATTGTPVCHKKKRNLNFSFVALQRLMENYANPLTIQSAAVVQATKTCSNGPAMNLTPARQHKDSNHIITCCRTIRGGMKLLTKKRNIYNKIKLFFFIHHRKKIKLKTQKETAHAVLT